MGLPISVIGESVLPIAQRENVLESSLPPLFIFHLTLSIPITLSNSVFKYSKSVPCLLMLSNSEPLVFHLDSGPAPNKFFYPCLLKVYS